MNWTKMRLVAGAAAGVLSLFLWPQSGIYWAAEVGLGALFLIEYVIGIVRIKHCNTWDCWVTAALRLGVLVSFAAIFMHPEWDHLRTLRVLAGLRLVWLSPLLTSFLRAVKRYTAELWICIMTLGGSLVLSGTAIWVAEAKQNPALRSITDGIWWALDALSSLGYGEVIAITRTGKIITSFVVILGIIFVGMITAVITRMFFDHFFGMRNVRCDGCHWPNHDFDARHCKHCGEALEDIEHPTT